MLAFVFLSPPLGVIFGYVLAAVVIDYTHWEVAFMIIAGITLMNFFLMSFFPAKYINTTDIVQQLKQVEDKKLKENYGIVCKDLEKMEAAEKVSTCNVICKLLRNGSFILIALSLSSLFYIVTGIQNWMTIYMVDGIGISAK
jgi:MFS family permease